ncbi:AraC family transcriptional regulator [Paenibacillus eucommiae]|uniref:AraC-like DNA-binding protein n=1 Tax=Paenibacillus eucommiae TaxID=1355755 RepID=A0ABS4ISL5_9BACL|nr:AraC family transcriptional regulator [Paenibacillus eucommiae]MBP1990572.1 AraC-like DNA-binding protein [Paenibacillus eucommiae]
MMKLDRTLINEPPTPNPIVENGFKNFPVYARQEFIPAHNQKLHVQPGIEINLTLEGKAAYVIDKQVYMQSPGHLLIFSGHVPHQVYIDPLCQYKRTVICFDETGWNKEMGCSFMPIPNFREVSTQAFWQIRLQSAMFANIKWIFSRISEEIQEQKSEWRQIAGSQFICLAAMIRRSMEDAEAKPDTSPITLCSDYISKHLHEDLSLQNTARMFHISPEHLTRQFKQEKGLSFYQYVLEQRVLESKRMLRDSPEMTLTDIAYAAGFSSAAQFGRVFKRSTSLVPSQFRSQIWKEGVESQ